jgi:hypothetical protein
MSTTTFHGISQSLKAPERVAAEASEALYQSSMVLITATMGTISAVAFGVATGTAGYVAVEHVNEPAKARELERGQATLASHLPDLSSWGPVAGMTAAAQVRES